jgi:hypothetical protein
MDIKSALDNLDKIKNGSEDSGDGMNKARAAFACGIIGTMTGLMVGYSKKWNLFYSAIVGGMIGVISASLFVPKDNK